MHVLCAVRADNTALQHLNQHSTVALPSILHPSTHLHLRPAVAQHLGQLVRLLPEVAERGAQVQQVVGDKLGRVGGGELRGLRGFGLDGV